MLKLEQPIVIGNDTFTHMVFVRGEFDIRLPAVDLHPALVRADGEQLLLGRVRLTDGGVLGDFTELLPAIRLSATFNSDEGLLKFVIKSFFQWLENLEQIAVGMQANENTTPFKHHAVALTKFPLRCTFEPLGDRTVGLEQVDERSEKERVAQVLGFSNWEEMNTMISKVNLSTPEKMARFAQWRDGGAKKDGLREILDAQNTEL